MSGTSRVKVGFYCVLLGVLYGCLNAISGAVHPPGCSFVELRPQVVLPMFAGITYGPIAGFFVGCLGDRLGYAITGLSIFHAWNWSIGNGFIGMIPGITHCLGIGRIKTCREFQIMLLLVLMASFLPIVFAASLDTVISHVSFEESVYTLILPAFITDAIFGLLLVPAMLLASRKMLITIETRIMLMTAYPLIFAVLMTYTFSNWSMFRDRLSDALLIRSFYNLGILSLLVLIGGLAAATFLARRITRPVVCVTNAAASIAGGNYEPSPGLRDIASRDDEMGQLAVVFEDMMQKVYDREQQLKNQVCELKIEIDKARQAREVAKITETDYFKCLREKAKKLRIE